ATVSKTEAADTISAAGVVKVTATAAIAEAPDTVAATATAPGPSNGAASITEADDSIAATGHSDAPLGIDAGSSISGGYFSRKRWHELVGTIAAEKAARERAETVK